MLGDEDYVVQNSTIQALKAMGLKYPKATVSHLHAALEDADPHVRVGSAAALVMISPKDFEARRVLVEAASSGLKSIYRLASLGLLSLGEEGVGMAVEILTDEEASTRWGAAFILGAMGEKAHLAVPALTRVAAEDDGSVRLVAIKSLGSIGAGAESAVPVLVDALNDIRSYIRIAARRALERIDPSALSELPHVD